MAAMGLDSGKLMLIDLSSGNTRTLDGAGDAVPFPVMFSHCGTMLASAFTRGDDVTDIEVFDLKSGRKGHIDIRRTNEGLPFMELLQWHPMKKELLVHLVYQDRAEIYSYTAEEVLLSE